MNGPAVRAYDTVLKSSGRAGHAVVVECGLPWRFVFWEKAQYVGCVDLGRGVWFTPEWCEVNSPNDEECYEPIMDKRLLYSSVEILERGPARARVKWSYSLADMRYRVFHGDSRAEEIYTIYPDGIALREVTLWPGSLDNHGGNPNFWQVQEWILLNESGTTPRLELADDGPFSVSDGNGKTVVVEWPVPDHASPLCEQITDIENWDSYIGLIRLKKGPSPFTIVPNSQALFPYARCTACGGDHPHMNVFAREDSDPTFLHWPATEREDFIGWCRAGDEVGTVATHTSFMNCNFAMRTSDDDFIPTPFPGTSWYVLVGATDRQDSAGELNNLAGSYRSPGTVDIVRDKGEYGDPKRGRVIYEGYDYSIKAYGIRQHGNEDRVIMRLHPDVPVPHPALRIIGWHTAPYSVRVEVDGRQIADDRYALQISENDLVVWLADSVDHTTQIGLYAE